MLASEHYGLVLSPEEDDWFDLIVDTDTRLFVDPFLIFKEKSGFWADAHAILIAHFDTCFSLIAASGGNKDSIVYKKALALLTFPEPKEFCLGYTALGIEGLGGGPLRAKTIATAIEDAIARGLSSLGHFEELGIFNKGIGPDGISDMTCNILKPKFLEYTQKVIARHALPTEPHHVFPLEYDIDRKSWSSGKAGLPTNPHTKGPIIFVPARFLRDLPTLSAEEWWTAYEAEQVRTNLNYEVLGKVNKEMIVETARRREQEVERWAAEKESEQAKPYDLERDSNGVYTWDKSTRDFVASAPLTLAPPQSIEEFSSIIQQVIDAYKHYIEEGGGWKLLWNDDGTEKYEDAAQLLFSGIAKTYCRTNNIVVDREVELGRGPVDFKFSNGFARRALLEIKKLHNGEFWNGLEAQLVSYTTSDQCKNAWFLALYYRSGGVSADRLIDLPGRINALQVKTGLYLKYGYVDARPRQSASKLKAV